MRPSDNDNQPAPFTVSISEAKRLTSLGRTSLYALMRKGTLRKIKSGARTLIRYDDLQRLVSMAEDQHRAANDEGDA
jgi:excisionase family DNA binding protein